MSVQDRVGAGVVTLLSGLAWGDGVTPLVVQRKRPEVAEQDATSATRPTVIVAVRSVRRTMLISAVKKTVVYAIGVYVAIPTPAVLGDTSPMAGYVELVRQGLHGDGTLPGVPESNEMRPAETLPWAPESLDKNFEWGAVAMDFETLEPRS